MKFQKYQTPQGHCIIKSNTYAHSYQYLERLREELWRDFPSLENSNVLVKVYNNGEWKGHIGLEFNARSQPHYFIKMNDDDELRILDCSHNDYELISQLPIVFN